MAPGGLEGLPAFKVDPSGVGPASCPQPSGAPSCLPQAAGARRAEGLPVPVLSPLCPLWSLGLVPTQWLAPPWLPLMGCAEHFPSLVSSLQPEELVCTIQG